MVDAVLVVDVEGRLSATNTATGRMTGYTPEQLRLMPVGNILVDESQGLRTIVRRRVEDGESHRDEQSYLVTSTGQKIPVSVTMSAVNNDQGHVQGIVLVARDMRELRQLLADRDAEIRLRRHAEDELRALNASIEAKLEETRGSLLLAERRATLGTLAGGVGHELRNIAQIQIAAVDELAAALAANEDIAALVRQILPDLERVGAHITAHGQRLMQLARPGPDHVQPLDLNQVVRDMITMLRGAGKLYRVEVIMQLTTEPIMVTVNRMRIEQILVNLIVNAVDAIGSANGKITVDVHPSTEGKRVVCEVRDTGSGIPADQLDKIFQPFFTTKGEDQGTGLGLPVAGEIVSSYGGSLTVVSAYGTGTTFTFDLPAS